MEAGPGFGAGAGIGFRITPLQAASRYGRVLPTHLFQSLPAGNKSGINTTFCTHAYMPYCGSQRAGAGQRADGRELKSATPTPGARGPPHKQLCVDDAKLVVTARVLVRFL